MQSVIAKTLKRVIGLSGYKPENLAYLIFPYFLLEIIEKYLTGDVSGMKAIYRFFLWEKPGFQFHRWDPRDLKFTEVIEYHSVERILDFNPLPDTTIYDGLIRLKKLNLIRLEA